MLTRATTLDTPRRLAVAACVGLFAALFAPWLSQTAVTRGLHGTLRLHQTMTGWQSLSVSALVALVVALALPAVLLGGAARPRPRARRRLEGTIAAAGGALTAITLIWTLAAHEGSRTAGPATLSDGVGWGVVLALVCAVALVACGAGMLRAAASPSRTHASTPAPAPASAPVATGGGGARTPIRTGAARTRTARSRPR